MLSGETDISAYTQHTQEPAHATIRVLLYNQLKQVTIKQGLEAEEYSGADRNTQQVYYFGKKKYLEVKFEGVQTGFWCSYSVFRL